MRWIALNVLLSLIRWIAVYSLESVVRPLYIRAQAFLALGRFRWSVAKQKENTTANHNKA